MPNSPRCGGNWSAEPSPKGGNTAAGMASRCPAPGEPVPGTYGGVPGPVVDSTGCVTVGGGREKSRYVEGDISVMSHSHRRLVRNRQTLFVRIVFFY